MEINPKSKPSKWPIVTSAIMLGLSHASLAISQDEIVHWPRLDFVIPFQIDANGQLPQEVILEVSENEGISWKPCSRGDTRTRQFHFKAPRDGGYEFRLKTVDSEGRKFNNPGDPLKIVVDTVKPTAKLATAMDHLGAMKAEFLVFDTSFDPQSLKLEYQTESMDQWREIPFEIEESTTEGEWTGFGTWMVPDNAKLVVRLIVKDKAGNTTEVSKFPVLPKTASTKNIQLASQPRSAERHVQPESGLMSRRTIGSGVANHVEGLPRVEVLGMPQSIKQELPDATDPNAIRNDLLHDYQLLVEQQQKLLLQNQLAASQQKLELQSRVPTDARRIESSGMPVAFNPSSIETQPPNASPNIVPQNNLMGVAPSATTRGTAIELKSSATSLPTTAPSSPDSSKALSLSNASPNFPVRSLTDDEIKASQIEPMQLANTRVAESRKSNGSSGSISLDSQPNPLDSASPLQSLELTRDLPPLVTRPQSVKQDPPGLTSSERKQTSHERSSDFTRDIKPLYSNTKTFSLDYRVDNDPGAPISEVELWGTTDQGQTWSVWGSDPDRRTPFDIEVETEGLFGFRMVIVGSNGLASNRPRNGDNADAWIHVDTARPLAKLNSALYGTGNEAGSLIIEYQARDEYFGDRPISLFYGETPDGPWQTISRNVRNQGRFAWPADPNLPPTIYLKLEAMDSAGNIATSVLDLPVNVEGIAPRGRIQGFRPIQRP